MCSPCMFTMSCPARARMPGIVLCLACLLMLGLPCLLPLPLPCSLCHALATREFYFLVISFLFVSPFCGRTKRIGPFVLPHKGRTVPSLFLFYPSADFRSLVLRPPTGAISVDRLLRDLATGVGSGFITNFDQTSWQHRHLGYRLPMGLMALRHRGKTATLATSPRVPPWWCHTVGLGIGCTSRLPSSQ